MYRFRLDEDRGVLFVYVIGRWTKAELQHFLPNLAKHVEIARQRFGRLRALVDAREMLAQDPKLVSTFDEIAAKLIQSPEDRFARVVASNLIKSQTRQNTTCLNQAVFLSESSALTWLVGLGPRRASAVAGEKAMVRQVAG